jgi:hypothetical protein
MLPGLALACFLLLLLPAVGMEQELADLLQLVLQNPGSGVTGVLVHGMGGVGKSTLAHQICHHFQQLLDKQLSAKQQPLLFAGGVYKVTIPAEVDPNTSRSALILAAQEDLLYQLTLKQQHLPRFDMPHARAQLLKGPLQNKGPVLLLIDNVPEDSEGLGKMLPEDLAHSMAPG